MLNLRALSCVLPLGAATLSASLNATDKPPFGVSFVDSDRVANKGRISSTNTITSPEVAFFLDQDIHTLRAILAAADHYINHTLRTEDHTNDKVITVPFNGCEIFIPYPQSFKDTLNEMIVERQNTLNALLHHPFQTMTLESKEADEQGIARLVQSVRSVRSSFSDASSVSPEDFVRVGRGLLTFWHPMMMTNHIFNQCAWDPYKCRTTHNDLLNFIRQDRNDHAFTHDEFFDLLRFNDPNVEYSEEEQKIFVKLKQKGLSSLDDTERKLLDSFTQHTIFPLVRTLLHSLGNAYTRNFAKIPLDSLHKACIQFILEDPNTLSQLQDAYEEQIAWEKRTGLNVPEFIEQQLVNQEPINLVFVDYFGALASTLPSLFCDTFTVLNNYVARRLSEDHEYLPAACSADKDNTIFFTKQTGTPVQTSGKLFKKKKIFPSQKDLFGPSTFSLLELPSHSVDNIIVTDTLTPNWAPFFLSKIKPGGCLISFPTIQLRYYSPSDFDKHCEDMKDPDAFASIYDNFTISVQKHARTKVDNFLSHFSVIHIGVNTAKPSEIFLFNKNELDEKSIHPIIEKDPFKFIDSLRRIKEKITPHILGDSINPSWVNFHLADPSSRQPELMLVVTKPLTK